MKPECGTLGAAKALFSSGLAGECLRILIEPGEEPGDTMVNLREIEAALGSTSLPRLLHGLDSSAWEMISLAPRRRYDTRIGFEDTLRLPDGTPAQSNAALVSAAFSIVETAAKERLKRD